jgi:hypothetical protein
MKKNLLLLFLILCTNYLTAQEQDSLVINTKDSINRFLAENPFKLDNYKNRFYHKKPLKKFEVNVLDTLYSHTLQRLDNEDKIILFRHKTLEFEGSFNLDNSLLFTYFYGIQAVTTNYTAITLFVVDESCWLNYILLLTYSRKGKLISAEIVACAGGDGGDYTIINSYYLSPRKLRAFEKSGWYNRDEKTERTYEIVQTVKYDLLITKNGHIQKKVLKRRTKKTLVE